MKYILICLRRNSGITCCVVFSILYKNFLISDDMDCLLINLSIRLFLVFIRVYTNIEIVDIDCLLINLSVCLKFLFLSPFWSICYS
jgi:hypothetical protein